LTIEADGQNAQADLAKTLRELRRASGLSGERLGARCAMSQAKISRIERNRIVPTVLDVERILSALQVPTEQANELIALARQANVEHTSWRAVAEIGLWRKQIELKSLAESCAVQRLFLPAMPSGLIQIPDYARAALSPSVDSSPARDIDKAVRARLERQTVLADMSRRFLFLLTEQAVRWQMADRRIMTKQCEHMVELSTRPNIDIAVVPRIAETPEAALNSFVIYDDRLVIAELFSGEVELRDPRDIAHHRDIFDFFYERSLVGDRARELIMSVRNEFM
jgi:transcriptional regulator with XRE-family HTH domain